MKVAKLPLLAIWAGTALENFDFAIYATGAALVFSKTFFPNISYELGILSSLATYAVGFLARPLGGFIFSHIGDTLGRKTVLVSTLFLMGLATFSIGLLPNYNAIGLAAPILLVFLRIVQGLGSGAEQAGGLVYLAEMAPNKSRGRWTSFVFVGTTTGTFLGALTWTIVKFLAGANLVDFAWRWVFLSSIVVTIMAFIIRLKLPESSSFSKLKQKSAISHKPIKETFQNKFKSMIRVFAVNIGANSASYIVHTFFTTYLTFIGLKTQDVPQILLFAAGLSIPSAYLGGILTDKLGAAYAQRLLQILTAVYLLGAFAALNSQNIYLIYITVALGYALVAALNSPQGVFFWQLFPTKYRYTGVTIPRELSSALGGGTAPLIASFIIFTTHKSILISLFCLSLLLISFIASSDKRN